MRTRFIIFTVLTIICVLPALVHAQQPPNTTERIVWHKNFKEAREIAKQTGKPMLIDFAADWCEPCKAMDRYFWPKTETVALSEKFVCVKMNFDLDPEVSRYKVDRIPAVVFTDPWGNFLTVNFGFGHQSPAALTQIMKVIPSDFSAINEWNGVLERDKENAAALVKVADFYRRNSVFNISNMYFKRALKTKEMQANADKYGELLIAVGVNHLKQQEYGDAKNVFDEYLKQSPNGKHGDTALIGIFTAHVGKKKLGDAEKTLEQLKSAYPNSPYVQQAAERLQQLKGQKN
ncbi:MAG TPA: thioredoxin family protein [Pyrinomonadaceae bacterium]|jgi:thioredoxin-like negative regulator of GroEL